MKQFFLKSLLALLFPAAFTAVFLYLCGTENSVGVWVSYGSIMYAYLLILITRIMKAKGKASFMTNSSVSFLALSYFFLECIVGVICLFWHPADPTWPIVLQAVPAVLYTAYVLIHMLAADATERSVSDRDDRLAARRQMGLQLNTLCQTAKSDALRKKLNECNNILRDSGTTSIEASADIDAQILGLLTSLKEANRAGNPEAETMAQELSDLLQERKTILKFNH